MHEKYQVSTGGEKSLTELSGENGLLLYFYPKDMTSGCTKQAEWLRDHHTQFKAKGIEIVGVSRDSMKRHHTFIEKHDLPFALISDEDSQLCNAFGVIAEKSMYGRKYLGIVRSTFLLNKSGDIQQEWRNVKLTHHFGELEALISEGSEKSG